MLLLTYALCNWNFYMKCSACSGIPREDGKAQSARPLHISRELQGLRSILSHLRLGQRPGGKGSLFGGICLHGNVYTVCLFGSFPVNNLRSGCIFLGLVYCDSHGWGFFIRALLGTFHSLKLFFLVWEKKLNNKFVWKFIKIQRQQTC